MTWVTTKNLQRFAEGFSEKAMQIFAKVTDIPSSLPANGGDSATVNGHTVESSVPSGAKFTDTTYTHPTSAGNKHIPAGGSPGQVLKNTKDGEAQWADEADTKYSNMAGATNSADGRSGLVPTPTKGQQNHVLTGGGTWKELLEATDAEIDAIIEGTFNQEGGN